MGVCACREGNTAGCIRCASSNVQNVPRQRRGGCGVVEPRSSSSFDPQHVGVHTNCCTSLRVSLLTPTTGTGAPPSGWCPLQPVDITSPGTALVGASSVDHPVCLCGPSWWRWPWCTRCQRAHLLFRGPRGNTSAAVFICPAGGSCLQGQAN